MDTEEVRKNLESESIRLSEMRDDLRTADELDTPENEASGGEISVADQHPADIATEQQYRTQDLSMLIQVESELRDVESALKKLDDGTYGQCEACGESIDPERLAALPAARYCVNDQSRAEAEVRPASATQAPDDNDNTSPI